MAGVRQFDERVALERALGVFEERGFRAATMADLAAGTGVQRGSLYHAYGGKEQIFVQAFRRHADRFLTGAAQALTGPDRRSALLSFFEFCIDAIAAGPAPRGCLSTRTATEATTDSGPVATAVRSLLDDLENLVHDGLAALGERGPAEELRGLARLMVMTTRGLAVMQQVGHGPAELRATVEVLVSALTSATEPHARAW